MDGVGVLYRVAGHQLLIELGFPDAAFLKFDILCTFFPHWNLVSGTLNLANEENEIFIFHT